MRYFGGKARIASKLSNYINNLVCSISEENQEFQNKLQNTSINTHTHLTYVEPFCGACNVASKINIESKILNDKHPYLIAMWKALQEGWKPPDEVTEEDYKMVKENQDIYPELTGFIGFGCSFAGKFFGGYAKCKRGDNYALQAYRSVLKKIKGLVNVKFYNLDFFNLDIPKGSIVYCDPPYKETTPYNKKLLGDFPYDIFIEWVKIISEENLVLVSEYKHNIPEDVKIVLEINSNQEIRCKNGRMKTVEVLFTYNNI